MNPVNVAESNRKPSKRRVLGPVQLERKLDIHFELLTLGEAISRYGLYRQRIYRWVRQGRLHPVKPVARTLYPAWELDALTGRTTSPRLTFDTAA